MFDLKFLVNGSIGYDESHVLLDRSSVTTVEGVMVVSKFWTKQSGVEREAIIVVP